MSAPQDPNQPPQQPPEALANPEPTIAIGGPGQQGAGQDDNPDATQVVRPGATPPAANDQPEATQVVRPGAGGPPSGPQPQQASPQTQQPQPQQPQGFGQPTPPPGYPQQQQPPQGYGQQPGYPPQPQGQPAFGQQLGQQPAPGYPPQQPAPGYPPQQPGYPPQQPGYPAAPAAPYQYGGGYQYASWGQRFVGGLIDYGSIGVINGIILGIAFGADTPALSGVAGLVGLIFIFYNTCYLGGTTGQTWGKKAAGIKVVREDSGQVIGFGLAFGRHLLHFIDMLPIYIGFFAPLWDPKRQTWADKIVNTIVIEAPKAGQGYPQPPQGYGQPQQYGQPPQQQW